MLRTLSAACVLLQKHRVIQCEKQLFFFWFITRQVYFNNASFRKEGKGENAQENAFSQDAFSAVV